VIDEDGRIVYGRRFELANSPLPCAFDDSLWLARSGLPSGSES